MCQTRVESRTSLSPPPPLGVAKENGPLKNLLSDRPTLGNVADHGEGSRVNVLSSEEEYNQNKKSIKVDDRKTRSITVKGVDLKEYLMRKNQDTTGKTSARKRNTRKEEDKKKKNLTPSSDKQNTLLNYIVRKTEDKNLVSSIPPTKTTTKTDTSVISGCNVTGDKRGNDPGIRNTDCNEKSMNVKKTFESVRAIPRVSVSERVKEFSKTGECLIGT